MQGKKLQRELAKVPPELHQIYRAVREMNTFVCEVCHEEELSTHPVLGNQWTPGWYLAMAVLARERGWVATTPRADREGWFFEDFQIIGPRCQTGKVAGALMPEAVAARHWPGSRAAYVFASVTAFGIPARRSRPAALEIR